MVVTNDTTAARGTRGQRVSTGRLIHVGRSRSSASPTLFSSGRERNGSNRGCQSRSKWMRPLIGHHATPSSERHGENRQRQREDRPQVEERFAPFSRVSPDEHRRDQPRQRAQETEQRIAAGDRSNRSVGDRESGKHDHHGADERPASGHVR